MQTTAGVLSPDLWELLPTDADVTFYEEHGWYIAPKVLSDASIAAAIAASERFYQGERNQTLPFSTGYSDWQPADGMDVMRNNEFVTLQNDALRQFALQPIIGAIAARLTRSPEIRLLDDQLVYKPPTDQAGKSAVGWHADQAYWSTCSSQNLITAWIPFHDCTIEQGPLVVIDGSHRWKNLEDVRYFNNPNLATVEAQLQAQQRSVVKVPMTLKKGQMSFHHGWTIHGSYPNHSQTPRLAMALHLQDGANHYQPFWTTTGKAIHIFDEQLCRKLPNGDPDFRDPAVFPTLWNEQ